MLISDQDLDAHTNNQVMTSPSLQYPSIVTELRIEQSQVTPIFTEATAQAARLVKAPVAILMVTGKAGCQIGAITGVEKFGHLPAHPNLLLELAGLEYCYAQVMSSETRFCVNDCQSQLELAPLPLVAVHGVQAYLGIPIVTAAQDRLGTIAILDFKPRQFNQREIELLQLISRLVASEFERKLLSQAQLDRSIGNFEYHSIPSFDDQLAATEYQHGSSQVDQDHLASNLVSSQPDFSAAGNLHSTYPQVKGEIQFKLLAHLAQELRTPLTSILGMASVLQQEIYGALSSKQKDYVGIIYQSGQQLVTIVDEISQLNEFDLTGENFYQPQPQLQQTVRSVDLEMICQLALQSLEPLAQKKNQQLDLDPTGWHSQPTTLADEQNGSIDKNKIRQIVYYLCLNLIHASSQDCQISIRPIKSSARLQIQLVTNDPQMLLEHTDLELIDDQPLMIRDLRMSLGLSLSHTLAIAHGGTIEIMADGRGYQFNLP
jgi:signal transduction histidine kinase